MLLADTRSQETSPGLGVEMPAHGELGTTSLALCQPRPGQGEDLTSGPLPFCPGGLSHVLVPGEELADTRPEKQDSREQDEEKEMEFVPKLDQV